MVTCRYQISLMLKMYFTRILHSLVTRREISHLRAAIDCVRPFVYKKRNRMRLIEKFENGGHKRSCETEHLYYDYIPCKKT